MENSIEALEKKISDMLDLLDKMGRENDVLRKDQQVLRQEFNVIQEKNKIARSRVEKVVEKLKSME